MPTAELKASEAGPRWAELIARVARADRTALAKLYDLSSPSVFGLILRIVGGRAAAEEVTLDVYAEVWKTAGRFDRDRGPASSWLFMLARHRAIAYLSSKEHQQPEPPFEPGPPEASAPVAEHTGQAFDHRRMVQSAFTSLDSKQRQAIDLAFFSRLGMPEIAVRLGEPLDAVGRLIHLGMVRLRDLLQAQAETS